LGFAIYESQYHYMVFGSWTLIAGVRHRRLRFIYDGKEHNLSVAIAKFPDSQSASTWQTLPSPSLTDVAGVNPSKIFEKVVQIVREQLSPNNPLDRSGPW
jgi:hypothetical protein